MNIMMKHFAIKLLIKHGTDGLHNMILKKDNFSAFQCYCGRLLKVLDMFEPFALKSDIKNHLLFIREQVLQRQNF